MDYRLLVDLEVVEFIERLPRRPREALRHAIRAIGGDPFGCSDALDSDATGRPVHIHIVGDWALIYWIDDADQHVKILDIHAADR